MAALVLRAPLLRFAKVSLGALRALPRTRTRHVVLGSLPASPKVLEPDVLRELVGLRRLAELPIRPACESFQGLVRRRPALSFLPLGLGLAR